MAKIKNETTTNESAPETLPMVPPLAPLVGPWTEAFGLLAAQTKAAYLDFVGKNKAERAAALIHGERLTELHRVSDKQRKTWSEVLFVIGIPERTASSHEAYYREMKLAKPAIEAAGGDPMAFSMPNVKAIAKEPETVENYDLTTGKRKPEAPVEESARLQDTIDKASEALIVAKKQPRKVKVKMGSVVVIDGETMTVEEGGIVIVVE